MNKFPDVLILDTMGSVKAFRAFHQHLNTTYSLKTRLLYNFRIECHFFNNWRQMIDTKLFQMPGSSWSKPKACSLFKTDSASPCFVLFNLLPTSVVLMCASFSFLIPIMGFKWHSGIVVVIATVHGSWLMRPDGRRAEEHSLLHGQCLTKVGF